MNLKRPLLGAAAFIAAGALLVGCAGGSTSDSDSGTTNGEVTYADTIHYPINATTASLDPQISPGGTPAYIGAHIFETLVAQDENLVPQPALAESWTVSEDGLTWEFTLRQGVLFHNGKELTAADVAASINRWKTVAGRGGALLGDSLFEVVDDYTVKVELESPRGDLLAQLANPLQFAAIMPAEIIENAPAEGVAEYIGTGPYELVEFNVDQQVLVTRFDDYTGVDTEPSGFAGRKDAPTENISFDFILDNSTRFSSFLSGDLDIVDVSIDNLPQVESLDDVTLTKNLGNSYVVVFNMQSPFSQVLENRQATALAIDADDYLTAAVQSPDLYRLNPSYAWNENSVWWTDAGSQTYYNQQDIDAAKQKLADAGYNGEVVRLLTSQEYGGIHYRATVILQSQLEAIGVNTELDVLDFASLVPKRNSFEGWDIYTGAFIVPSTPSQLIYLAETYGGNDDPELARLITATAEAQDADAQQAASVALEEYLWSQLTTINIGDSYNYRAIRDNVEGFVNATGGYPILWNAKVAE